MQISVVTWHLKASQQDVMIIRPENMAAARPSAALNRSHESTRNTVIFLHNKFSLFPASSWLKAIYCEEISARRQIASFNVMSSWFYHPAIIGFRLRLVYDRRLAVIWINMRHARNHNYKLFLNFVSLFLSVFQPADWRIIERKEKKTKKQVSLPLLLLLMQRRRNDHEDQVCEGIRDEAIKLQLRNIDLYLTGWGDESREINSLKGLFGGL